MAKLSADIIATEALALVDELGESGLSMRTLAKRLDVSAMSLYTYFPSRNDLVDATLSLMREGYDNSPIPGEFWEDTLRRTTASIRAVALKHAKAYRAQHGYEPAAKEHTRRVFQLHRDQGMPLAVYRRMWSALEAYLVGFITNEISQLSGAFEPLDPDDPDYEWLLIAENAYCDESFARGIDLIIHGVRDLDPEGAKTWRTPEDTSLWTWK